MSKILNRYKSSFFFAFSIFSFYLLFMTTLIVLGQNKLLEYEKKESFFEVSKLSFTLDNILNISKEYLNILSQSKTVTSYFSNKALGMSLQYGLKANIVNISKELNDFLKNKQIENIKLFENITIVDNLNEIIYKTSDFNINETLKDYLKEEYVNSSIISIKEGNKLNLYLIKSVFINENKVGTIFSKLNSAELLNSFIINGRFKQNIFLYIDDEVYNAHNLLISESSSENNCVKEDLKNSNISLLYNYKSNEKFYTTRFFTFILVILSILLYLVMYYIFKVNSRNLYLKATMARSEKLNKLLEQRVKQKTIQLEEFNNKLQQKIQTELEKNRRNQSIIYNQSKMAMMGQMLDNIAHQWRQPLSAISSNASFIKLQDELDILERNSIGSTMDNILLSTKFLSETIEDFRSFLRENRQKEFFDVKEVYLKTKKLLISVTKKSDVCIIDNIEDIKIYGYPNELVQVLLNLINNCYDAFLDVDEDRKKFIFIDIYEQNKNVVIKITDNATGISPNIKDKIFDAHFSTKLHTTGTGIGLYMTKEIINNMNGEIEINNVNYPYESEFYYGAQFKIILPMKE